MLVSNEFTQNDYIDYEEILSPIVMLKFVRNFLTITAYKNYEIEQRDVKTTFLNVYLEKYIFRKQSNNFTVKE